MRLIVALLFFFVITPQVISAQESLSPETRFLDFRGGFEKLVGEHIPVEIQDYFAQVMPHSEAVWIQEVNKSYVIILVGTYPLDAKIVSHMPKAEYRAELEAFRSALQGAFEENNPESQVLSQLVETGQLTVISAEIKYRDHGILNTDYWYSFFYRPDYRLDLQISLADDQKKDVMRPIRSTINKLKQRILRGTFS
jgi:hypothetical protein